MSMPSSDKTTQTYADDEDVPSSSDNQVPKNPTRQSYLNRLSKTLDKVIREHNAASPAKRKREVDPLAMLERKMRLRKLRVQLKEMNEIEPDSDYLRDDDLLTQELSTVNKKLASIVRSKTISDEHAVAAASAASATTGDSGEPTVTVASEASGRQRRAHSNRRQ